MKNLFQSDADCCRGAIVTDGCNWYIGKNLLQNISWKELLAQPFTQTLELAKEQILPKKINKLKKAISKNLLKHVNSG